MDWIMERIARRIKFAIFFVSGYLLLSGVARLYEGVKYGQRHIMRYEDFIKNPPTEGWYRIAGGMMNALEQSHEEKETHDHQKIPGGAMDEYFVPIRSKKVCNGKSNDLTTYVIAQTQEPSMVDAIHAAYNDLGDAPTMEQMNEYAGKNRKALFQQRDVEGMIHSGKYVTLPSTHTEFFPQKRHLAPNYVTIEERSRPEPALGLIMIVLGLALLAGQAWYYFHHVAMNYD